MSLQQVWTWKRKAILLQNSYKSKVPHPTLLHNEHENTVSVVFGMFSWKKMQKKQNTIQKNRHQSITEYVAQVLT